MIDQSYGGSGITRPPVNPPQLPTMSSIPMGSGQMMGDDGGGMEGKTQAMSKMFFDVEQKLNTIASIAPEQSEMIDHIRMKLRDVLTAIAQRATGQGSRPMMPTQGYSEPLA